jgi:hypothetical protein
VIVWELAKRYGAYACLQKKHATGQDLERAIQRAVEFVRQMPSRSHLARLIDSENRATISSYQQWSFANRAPRPSDTVERLSE